MINDTAIIIFAKAPIAGYAKTRLIPALGKEGAARLASRMLTHTLHIACTSKVGDVHLCYASDVQHPIYPSYLKILSCERSCGRIAALQSLDGVNDPSTFCALHCIPQSSIANPVPSGTRSIFILDKYPIKISQQTLGDLGARMYSAFEEALQHYQRVLLIGTDAVDLTETMLEQACSALIKHDAVFIPSVDGGYALVGLSRLIPEIFQEIPWSTHQVMDITRSKLTARNYTYHELAPITDIDEPKDLNCLPAYWLSPDDELWRNEHSKLPTSNSKAGL